MQRPPRHEYDVRLHERRTRRRVAQRQIRGLAAARLGTFLAALVWAWWVYRSPTLSGYAAVFPLAPFGLLVVLYERAQRAARRAERAVAYYERARDRLELEFVGRGGSAGLRFQDPLHPYASHLDLFGPGSLFELLSQAQTRGGEERLAEWLLAPAGIEVLRERHGAVAELRECLDLREDLAILGPDIDPRVEASRLVHWGQEDPHIVPLRTRVLAGALAATTVLAAVGALLDWVGWLPFLVAALAELTFSLRWRLWVRGVLRDTDRMASQLALLAALLERIEHERFSAPRLVALAAALETDGLAPSAQIERLRRRVDLLEARRNQFFAPFAPFLLWTTQTSFAIAEWRRECGPALGQWLDVIAEIEALSDLATYAYEHPDDPFPELVPEGPCFEASGLGHPLILDEVCVRNDLRLDAARSLYVVSGSNMSGKSTFLRSIGTNIVLALAGAPVRARRLRLSPLAVGASIRIQDSLREGSSRFYAEIQALRRIVELTSGPLPVVFLLDEIFAGTNSHDRGVGASALVRQLLQRGAVGLLTTHDLALARICDEWEGRAQNVHFEDALEDGVMRFDYRLRPGVVQKSNALELMRSVGLDV